MNDAKGMGHAVLIVSFDDSNGFRIKNSAGGSEAYIPLDRVTWFQHIALSPEHGALKFKDSASDENWSVSQQEVKRRLDEAHFRETGKRLNVFLAKGQPVLCDFGFLLKFIKKSA